MGYIKYKITEKWNDLIFWLVGYWLEIIRDLKYSQIVLWFQYRFIKQHQYHLIRIGKPGYYEQPERIREGVFKCFIEFYEGEYQGFLEMGGSWGDETFTTKDLEIKQNIEMCYSWIKFGRKELEKQADAEMDWKKCDILENELTNTDTKVLHEIITLRDYLWT